MEFIHVGEHGAKWSQGQIGTMRYSEPIKKTLKTLHNLCKQFVT